jgi:hypothetical protein
MPRTDARVDTYIANARDFAKPILAHLRRLIHEAAPEISETVKWGHPAFEYKGIVCSFAAFKEHVAFGFWKQPLLEDDFPKANAAMGSFGRITAVENLPKDSVLRKMIRQAVELNEKGIKAPRKSAPQRRELVVPEVLLEALAGNKKAAETFDSFPYSCRKEYVEWITEAKTDATRNKRVATTIEWLSEGKRRNWKYEKR